MAYRHFDSDATISWAATTPLRPAPQQGVRSWTLTFEERQIVLLSRHDATATLRAPSRLGRAARLLFGHQPANRLANPQLEALRRFAVLRRVLGDALPAAEIEQLTQAGYDMAAASDVDRLLLNRTTQPQSVLLHALRLGALALLALFGLIQLAGLLARVLDDALLGFVLAGLIVTSGVPVAALFLPRRRRLG